MPVASEIASMLDALDAPAMLIRPEDLTVAAVNDAFAQAYGRFRFEGRCCWEALHRSGPCPKSGLPCPLSQVEDGGRGVCSVKQILYSSARMTELTVTMRPVLTSDGKTLYWLETLKSKFDEEEPFRRGIVGISQAHALLMRKLEEAALRDEPYLIVGEAGLGKELYARTVHENSVRAANPFVVTTGDRLAGKDAQAILCGQGDDPGLLRRADGGTLFIGAIESVSGAVWELLDRVIQTAAVSAPDGRLYPVSVRVAASAECRPESAEKDSALQRALNEHCIQVVPLRERKEDIVPLAKFFVSGITPIQSRTITQEALECLRRYDWPGNVRELKEILTKAVRQTSGCTITSAALSLPEKNSTVFAGQKGQLIPLSELKDRYLLWAVENFSGSRSELAEKLGVSERTLYRLYARSKERKT